MKIELKAIKYAEFASEETSCYTANLYVDGKKIGIVSNEGRGGSDRFHGDHAAYETANEWCKANLTKWSLPEISDVTYDTDLEHHCGDLLLTWLVMRDYKRVIKTKVLMYDPVDGKIYAVKHHGSIDATITKILKERPDVKILNQMSFSSAIKLYRS